MGQVFDALDGALEADAWNRLELQHPILADGVQVSVTLGATPERIKRHVLTKTGQWDLARRCELAARWLVASEGE